MEKLLELGKMDKNDNQLYLLDHRKWNCLHYAMYNGWPRCVKKLVEFDADADILVKMQTSQGKLPFNLAKSDECKRALNRKYLLYPNSSNCRNLGCV